MEYTVYTDGGYTVSKGVGGSAFVILKGDKLVSEGAYKVVRETSQRAELKAIILAIWKVPEGSKVTIYTDSRYSITVLGRVPKNPKKNLELIARYWELKKARRLTVVFEWVKGHNGNRWNEHCDHLCTEAMTQAERFVFHQYDKLEQVDNVLRCSSCRWWDDGRSHCWKFNGNIYFNHPGTGESPACQDHEKER